MENTKLLENTARWRKTKRGLVTNLYSKLKSRNYVEFDLEYFHQFANCKKFNRLYSEWVKSNYNKQLKPSVDRISNASGYLKNNIQWLTWAENRFKQNMERRNRSPKVEQLLNGVVVNTYKSQRDAVIKTGISQGNLCSALTGKRVYAAGYQWRYETPELLNQNIKL